LATSGKISGTVYHNVPSLNALSLEATKYFGLSNPLHADIFKGLRKMEAEVVTMVIDLFHGKLKDDKDDYLMEDCASGTITSGGTESILLACKTYRDYYRDKKGIYEPEM
jgi:sphinganine-1-phosphate aldolase